MVEGKWEELLEQIEQLIEDENFQELKRILDAVHAADIAMLFPKLSRVEQHMVFDLIDSEKASDILVEVNDQTQEKILQKIDDELLSDMVDEMEPDEAADVLASVEPEKVERILEAMPEDVRLDVTQLLTYKEDTAGGIMSTDLVSVWEDSSVREAIDEIRSKAEDLEDIYVVWVVDQDDVLKGYVSLKRLLIARGNTKINSILKEPVYQVHVDLDQEEVAHMMRRYDLVTLPVVDDEGKLIGRITHDDAMEVLSEESHEDLSYISGTRDEEPAVRSVFSSSKERLPWLIAGLAGGIVAALVMSRFEMQLDQIIVLAFFVPIITAMGGNVGMQSSTIIVRGLATGEISFSDTGQRVLKELGVALINGLVLGLLLTGIIWLWQGKISESLVISLSMVVVMILSALIGVTVPLMLKKLSVDPALAMGPFVTITNDIVGVFIYLTIATVILLPG